MGYQGKRDRAESLSNTRKEAVYETIMVEPVCPVIGVEVAGVDMTKPIPNRQVEDLTQALANHNVLFFRDQPELTPEQQIAFSKNFGPLHLHPASPSTLNQKYPELLVIHTDGESTVNDGADWHTDVSSDEEPPLGSILQLHRTPRSGGDTLFASMYAAYEALSPIMKAFLSQRSAIHDPTEAYSRHADHIVGKVFPAAEHPVVRTHPVSGRQALFVNEVFTTRIQGMAEKESDALLEFLFRHMARAEFQVRFRWTPNAVAFWDNRSTQHIAMWDYWPEERYGHRVTVLGDRPFHRAA